MSETLPPAGWHLDPAKPGSERWWDGQSWTENYRPAPGTVAPKNTPATLGLVFGIASAFLFELLIPGPAAIVLSIVGIRRANALGSAGNRAVGRGPAIAGLILGIVYTLLPILKIAIAAS